ncbi:MAG TPA: NADP-dependent phosphogluconate dehydrogenase [Polyangia bacterium]|nr:NADP-dependent phosphogluconate dehydrogenase [Polyangia bacterium]
MTQPTFGMIGLGTMGENLALNLDDHGTPVAVWNLESEWTDKFVAAHPQVTGTRALQELVKALPRPRRIMMMIKAGAPVDMTLDKLEPLLEPGDVVIDGGNSWFKDTQRREAAWRPLDLHFVGMGVSGGSEGARRGPSMMPGGSKQAWEALAPALKAIAAQTKQGACVTYVGPDGAGHFVKMVHNGIEYGDMQLIAEIYDVLRRAFGYEAGRIADIFDKWNGGILESFLVELSAKVLRVPDSKDPKGGALVDHVLDVAGQKGTGKWSAQVALDLAVPIPTINAAIDARLLSALKAERVAASKQLAGPASSTGGVDEKILALMPPALYAAKLCSYAQGMALIAAGSHEWKWDIDLKEMARIWTGGCIIRARLLEDIMRAFERDGKLANLLLDADVRKSVAEGQAALRQVLALAQARGIPTPALSASLAYYDAYRTADLPQNLTQAQRDAFGAHTYQRSDAPDGKPIHTDWLGDDKA